MIQRKFRKLAIVACASFGLLSVAPARADSGCNTSISASNIAISWNQNFNFQAVTITVSKGRKQPCRVTLGFSRGGSTDYNRRMTGSGGTLAYQIYRDAALTQVLKDVPDITGPNDSIVMDLPQGDNVSASTTYYVQIPLNAATQPAYKRAGVYSDSFMIRAYAKRTDNQGQDENAVGSGAEASSAVTIATTIPKILEISILPPGGSFDASQTNRLLDFGMLEGPGTTRAADLRVRTNAGYAIFFSSQNNGSLKRTSGGSQFPRIPYTMQVNSSQVGLGSSSIIPVLVAWGFGQTSSAGNASSLAFTTGSVSSSTTIAGQYQDVITVTVATTE